MRNIFGCGMRKYFCTSLLPHPQERVLCATVRMALCHQTISHSPFGQGGIGVSDTDQRQNYVLISDARMHARLGHVLALDGRTVVGEHGTQAIPKSWTATPRYAIPFRMCRTHEWSGSYLHNQRAAMNNPHPSQMRFVMMPQYIHGRNSITTSTVPAGTRTP